MAKIIIDPGHGGSDSGAVHFPYKEKDWALDIALNLADALADLNFQVSMTRDSDITLKPRERAELIRTSRADICISVHINAGGGRGAETIHSIHQYSNLAQLILEQIKSAGMPIRRAYSRESEKHPGQDYYFIHRDTRPVETVIVEYGFIDNLSDRHLLTKASWRKALAQATAAAVHQYWQEQAHKSSDIASRETEGKVLVVDCSGKAHLLKAEQTILREGRWFLEGRTLASLLQGKVQWIVDTKQAVFDFSRDK